MRNNKDYCLISCGSNGQNGVGGLSVIVCLDGKYIFVDPGTYVYTSAPVARNIFRSTAYHNSVWIEGLEQNRIPKGNLGLFRLHNDVHRLFAGNLQKIRTDLLECILVLNVKE